MFQQSITFRVLVVYSRSVGMCVEGFSQTGDMLANCERNINIKQQLLHMAPLYIN